MRTHRSVHPCALVLAACGAAAPALRAQGPIRAWGQTGAPYYHPGPYLQASAGYGFSLAVKANGELEAWDGDPHGNTNVPSGTFEMVSGGWWHSLGLRSDGTIAAWGTEFGAGFPGYYGEISNTPTNDGYTYIHVSAGEMCSLAVRKGGTLVVWGPSIDPYGFLSAPTGYSVAQAEAGDRHGVALLTGGSLIDWGRNDHGQTDNTPTGNDFVKIAVGQYHSLALRADGTMEVWGWDDPTFHQVSGRPYGTFIDIAGTYHGSVAIRSSGELVAWGDPNILNPPAGEYSALATAMSAEHVMAYPGCYANCDGSTTAPILNVLDFTCFLNLFASNDNRANCDNTTAPPYLTVADYACFINKFSAGCS